MKKTIDLSDIDLFEKDCLGRDNNDVLRHIITNNGINASSVNEELARTLKDSFSVDVPAGNVCNQRRSGRCWMFAGLNVLRTIVMKTLNVKNFELSQAYLQFYDKLEKSNFFLEKALEYSDEEPNSRVNLFLLDTAIGDGGHFAMFVNLVKKYGVVPFDDMPDLSVSKDTGELNTILSSYLAQGMMELRAAKKNGASDTVLERMKEGYLNDVYRILSLSLGKPVKEFVLEYTDKDNKYHNAGKFNPHSFYNEFIKADLDDYICLCHAPMEGRKDYQKYTSKLVNNVEGGDPVIFFNVDLDVMKKSAIASLKGGDVMWFAADVLTQSMRKEGYLADGILKTKELFNINYKMNKAERLMYRTSFCNHAMTFTGVNLTDNDVPNRWKVENSWGKENGKDGYFIMDDKWFDEYVYEIFVSRKYVDEETLKKYDASSIIEEDPFNTLYLGMK